MQGFIVFVLIFGFISPCLCTELNVKTENAIYNVIQFGARGDGKSDDSQVYDFSL
jgi:polygalacturonase